MSKLPESGDDKKEPSRSEHGVPLSPMVGTESKRFHGEKEDQRERFVFIELLSAI